METSIASVTTLQLCSSAGVGGGGLVLSETSPRSDLEFTF